MSTYWQFDQIFYGKTLTMYALEIVPFSSLVTSINPSQSHSSSWITSTHYLSQFMTSVSLKNHPFCSQKTTPFAIIFILSTAQPTSSLQRQMVKVWPLTNSLTSTFLFFTCSEFVPIGQTLLSICTNWSWNEFKLSPTVTNGSSGREPNAPILATCFTRFTCLA